MSRYGVFGSLQSLPELGEFGLVIGDGVPQRLASVRQSAPLVGQDHGVLGDGGHQLLDGGLQFLDVPVRVGMLAVGTVDSGDCRSSDVFYVFFLVFQVRV